MDRRDQLKKVFNNIDANVRSVIDPMIDHVVFLENKLDGLKELPFIQVHPTNPALQKPTPAAKMYKELLQQYNNCVKILCSAIRKTDTDDYDPVAEFMEKMKCG